MKKIMSFVVILSMLFAPVAFSASPWTEQKSYPSQIWGKLQFGLTNTLLGWVELFATPNRYAGEGKNIWKGAGQGVVDAASNTFGGLFQLVTFPIPVDLVLPHNGVDLGVK
ncbi:MAG: hypothetical protein WCJ71_01455 [Candidatus Omnitrophota bacterium]